jgi:pimeloyl-ACP methyl ester carboxylesterase
VTKINEKTILVDGLRINYKIAGSGPAILVLHGWGGSSNSWIKVQEILAKKGFKVVVPDLPGFGKSATPKDSWGIKAYTDFVLSFVKKIELEDFFLIGHSFGGRISIRLAAYYPKKIKKLILCDAAGIKLELDFKAKIVYFLSKMGNTVFSPKFLARFKDSARNFFYIFLRHKDYTKADGVMKEIMKKVIYEDLLPDLEKIKIKTLVIWGEKDKLVPLKYAYVFEEKVKGSKLEVMLGIGHSPHLEDPKNLSEIITGFTSSNILNLLSRLRSTEPPPTAFLLNGFISSSFFLIASKISHLLQILFLEGSKHFSHLMIFPELFWFLIFLSTI